MTGNGPPATVLPFDVCGPLPTGTTVLEASAGTGKTHTVGALVTRYIAEGVATLAEMLIVTFGRAASQELRERVRVQLVAAERALADPAAARAGPEELLAHLADCSDAEVEQRRRRLTLAVADFDAGTIATTHQFCQQVLIGLGVAGDSETTATLVDNLDDLVVEVVDDIYLRAFAVPGAGPPRFDRAMALQLGRAAIGDPQAQLEPTDADPGSDAQWQRRFAEAVRTEVDHRKRQQGLLGYDDLLSRLAGALSGEQAAARDRMRSRWSVVLVDEFQDTDPVQWEVLRLAFAGHATLVLIGDPKQSIYAFRGGDIVTYLSAVRSAQARSTLDRNWRTDAPLAGALEALLGDIELGDPDIVVRPVTTVHRERRLTGAPMGDPLRLRVVRRDQFGSATSLPPIAAVRDHVARDLASDIAALLGSPARLTDKPVVAGDIAVLVATHHQANLARQQLAARGVPTVIGSVGSVYATAAGQDWLILLQALEQPHRADLVRAAALTPLLGRTADELGRGGDRLTDELIAQVQRWAELFAERGIAALLEVSTAENGLWPRLLAAPDGERQLTDLRHVAEGMQAAAMADRLGLSALIQWLRRRATETVADRTDERSRRLDSDAAAVQIVTLHASKGLEYPIVYLPFAFDRFVADPRMLLLHNDNGDRLLDVGGPRSAGWMDRRRRSAAEEAGEALRLLYVGLTRAQSQVVIWWAPSRNTPAAGLHRVLFGRSTGSTSVPDTLPVPTDDQVDQQLARLSDVNGLSVEPAVPAPPVRVEPRAEAPAGFAIGLFDRALDTEWRRSSYSSLIAGAEHGGGGVASEPETLEVEDEQAVSLLGSDIVQPGSPADIRSPMADLPAGAAFGTLVHAILETVDTGTADLAGELLRCGREQLARHPVQVSVEALAGALVAVMNTPMDRMDPSRTLAAVRTADRLTELTFELPLTGGDRPVGHATAGDLAPLLRRHLAPGDPMAEYAHRLTGPDLGEKRLRGYLNGSIDAVLRWDGPRYVIVDYKTNYLGEFGGPELTAWDYRPAALAAAMIGSDYPLQALLYTVALHRFLRWRQPGYDPELHLGGVRYLFVRGMCGPETPFVDGSWCGVFDWQPPAALITDLSALLDRGL